MFASNATTPSCCRAWDLPCQAPMKAMGVMLTLIVRDQTFSSNMFRGDTCSFSKCMGDCLMTKRVSQPPLAAKPCQRHGTCDMAWALAHTCAVTGRSSDAATIPA